MSKQVNSSLRIIRQAASVTLNLQYVPYVVVKAPKS